MITLKELEKRAAVKRPDPGRDPKAYQRWQYARKILGLPWRVAEAKGRVKREATA